MVHIVYLMRLKIVYVSIEFVFQERLMFDNRKYVFLTNFSVGILKVEIYFNAISAYRLFAVSVGRQLLSTG